MEDFTQSLPHFGVLSLLAVTFVALSGLISIKRVGMSTLGFCVRIAIALFCMLLCAAYGVVASIALRLVGYGGLSQWTVARSYKYSMKLAAGVEFVVQDDEHHLATRPAVFIGNHQTALDVLMLGSIFPPYCSVTAKKQLKWVPFLGWFMALSKTVFIDRANRQAARSTFDGAANTMRAERQSVYIFPEGTRSYFEKPDMLPFKKGAFHLAVQAQVPIVPIVVANYSHVLSFKRMTFASGNIPVKVLAPIDTKGLTTDDVADLTDRVRDQMMIELQTLTVDARKQSRSTPSALVDADPKKEN